VLIALGLVIGTVLLLRAAARLGGRWHRQAIAGATAIAVAVAAGILTLVTKSNWWSYAMAVGFIAALLVYGSLLLPATAPTQDSTPSSAPVSRRCRGGIDSDGRKRRASAPRGRRCPRSPRRRCRAGSIPVRDETPRRGRLGDLVRLRAGRAADAGT
jgi:uncharacterized protein (DUF58 family)